jgi:hypothetical protein
VWNPNPEWLTMSMSNWSGLLQLPEMTSQVSWGCRLIIHSTSTYFIFHLPSIPICCCSQVVLYMCLMSPISLLQ